MAKLLEWCDEYAIGIEEIDVQHKALVDLVNEIDEAVHLCDDDKVRETLAHLAECTRDHFAKEENLMTRLGYAFSQTHRLQHAELIEQIDAYQSQVAVGEIAGFEVVFFLKTWLTQHILGSDEKIARFSEG